MLRRHFRLIAILCLISSLSRFVLDSYLPSLPGISRYFAIPDARTEMTLTLYLLGFGLSQLLYGPLSDHFGRKGVMLAGLGIFFAGNLACALAASANLLMLARFVAGAGAGSCGVLNRAIASDCFSGAEFSKAWSYTTTTLVVTLCLAPVLGGYVQEILGWRANFFLSTLLVAVVLVIIIGYLPETAPCKTRPATGSAGPVPRAGLSPFAVLKNYRTVLTAPCFLVGTLCYTLAFSGLIAYFQVSPLLFIDNLGLTPAGYGWTSLLIALNYLAGGLIVGRFAKVVGTERLLVAGAVLLIAGGGLMWLVSAMRMQSVMAILLAAAIYVIGARIVIPNAIAVSLEQLRHLNGSSSAMTGFIQMAGSSMISYAIARFDNDSTLPLALFFLIMGCVTLALALAIYLRNERISRALATESS